MALGGEAGSLNIPGGGIDAPINVEIPTKVLCLTEVLLFSSIFSCNLLKKLLGL